MKILIVCQRYWPEQFQITSICEGLSDRGHDVTVLCGLPNVGVPEGKPGMVPKEYRGKNNRSQVHNGVRVIRSFEIGRRTGPFWRFLNYLSFWKSASHKVLEFDEQFDVTFAYQLSPATMAAPALTLKKAKGTPYLLYCCDAWPEWVRAVLQGRFPLLERFFGRICKPLYCEADRLVVQTPSYIDYFLNVHHVREERLSYIPQFSTDNAGVNLIPHEGINLLFVGNMGALQCIPLIIEAFSRCAHIDDFHLHFVGDGSELATAKKLVDEKGLSGRVHFHGRKRFDEMPRYYGIADICVLALDSSTLIGSTIPSKLQGYMGAGKPVVAAIEGGARFIIEEADCGIVVPPGDAEAFSEAMSRLALDSGLRERLGYNGRMYFEQHFTQDAYLDALEHSLLALAEKGDQ